MIAVTATQYPTRQDVHRAFPRAFCVRIAATIGKLITDWYIFESREELEQYQRQNRIARGTCEHCGQIGFHMGGCPDHPDYFRDCLMDAHYRRSFAIE